MTDPIAEPGTVRDDVDAKAWFYLDNRREIETWAALREDARAIVDRHLVGLLPLFEDLAVEHDAELDVEGLDGGPWPRIGLGRSSWRHAGLCDVSVVVEWERAKLLTPGNFWPAPGPNEYPYVAVLVSRDQESRERRAQVEAATEALRARWRGRRSRPWAFWRYVLPNDARSALDPEELGRRCVTAFQELWREAAPALDAIHADPDV